MKKIIAILFAVLFLAAIADAVPARRGTFKYTQPDGTVLTLRLNGDEFFHWVTNEAGETVALGEDGFYRPVEESTLTARRNAARARRTSVNRARAKSGSHVAVGQKHFLVILVQFSDTKFKTTNNKAAFTNMLNQQGYSGNGGTGSARDFYFDNSNGYFEPIFDVYGPVTLTNKVAYYGGNDSSGNDKAPEQAVKEACEALNSQIDFAQYDNDGDGAVDLVFMYYAGYGEADYSGSGAEDTIWPHQWELSEAGISLTLDGKKVDKYACSNELIGYGSSQGKMEGIGTACHEFGHAMGLPDFYDTDYNQANGEAGGLYDYSTMCGGPYNNEGRTPPYFTTEERVLLGWLDAEDAYKTFDKSGSYTLTSVQNGNQAYMVPTDKDGEYFAFECRTLEGWDKYIPQPGLVVYHVDKSDRSVKIYGGSRTARDLWENWEETNSINENGNHPCYYVVPAYSNKNYNVSTSNYTRLPFPGSDNITDFVPVSWNKVTSEIIFSNIAYGNNASTFYVTVPSDELDYPVIVTPEEGGYTVGQTFPLSLTEVEGFKPTEVSWFYDDEPVTEDYVVLKTGTHTIEAQLRYASGKRAIVTLDITVD